MKVEEQHLLPVNMSNLLRRLHIVKVEHFKLTKCLAVNIVYYPWQQRSTDKQTVWKAFTLIKDIRNSSTKQKIKDKK